MDTLKTYQDAWNTQEKYKDLPHGWIQWKGTDVCMDIRCECGDLTHVDGDFTYVIQCGSCGKKYFVNGHIQLIPIEFEDGWRVTISEQHDKLLVLKGGFMDYTVKFDIYFDGEDEPMTDKELKGTIEDMIESAGVSMYNFEVLRGET